jgi:hypothetical protein
MEGNVKMVRKEIYRMGGGGVWTGFIWLKIGISGGLL